MFHRTSLSITIATVATVVMGTGLLAPTPAAAESVVVKPRLSIHVGGPYRPPALYPPFHRDPFFWRFDDPFFEPRPVSRVRCGWRRSCRFVPRRLRVWSERHGRWVWRKVYVKKCRKVRFCRPYRRW